MQSSQQRRFLNRATPPHILTLVSLAGLSALAMNVFLPSLGAMSRYFEVEYAFMQLAVALYLAVSGVLQLFIGPLSDKYGRRSVMLWGIGLFCLATLGCLLAPTASIFMFFRMCQAVVAVAMVLSRAVVRDIYPQDRAASMIGYVAMGMSVIPMFAPALGGFLEVAYGWQASFSMLLIGGLVMFAIAFFDMAETAPKSSNSLTQQFAEYPELLRSPRFWGYCLTSACSSGAFFAYLGGSTFVGTSVFGLTPDILGIYFAAPSLGYFLGNFLTGRFAARKGINFMITWGNIICVSSLLFSLGFTLTHTSNALTFFGAMIIVGIGNGMVIPNAQAGMLSVRPHLAGTASGLGSAIMIGGGAGLAALAGALLTPGSSELPLMVIMTTVCALAVTIMALVTRRERQLGSAL